MVQEAEWKAVADVLATSLSIATAFGVAWIAYQQWVTARNKLALDLFDRRHTIWRELSTSYSQATIELIDDRHEDKPFPYVSTGLGDFGRAKEKAYFLFGPEVLKLIHEIEMLLFHQRQRDSFGNEPLSISEENEGRVERHRQGLRIQEAWTELIAAIEPYMMMRHVAVRRPSKKRS